jgi:Trk K+ transport system NAD-binding subunit
LPEGTKCPSSTPTRCRTSVSTPARARAGRTPTVSSRTALEVDALIQAGIERADVFIASTAGDNTNLVIAQIAQKRFGVEKAIVRVMDPARADWYREQGLQTISPTKHAIEMFESALQPEAV